MRIVKRNFILDSTDSPNKFGQTSMWLMHLLIPLTADLGSAGFWIHVALFYRITSNSKARVWVA